MTEQLKRLKPTTSGTRGQIRETLPLTREEPERSLTYGRKRRVGRSLGKVTSRHKGGGAKRLFRFLDFKRDKKDVPARVFSIEYDPNRTSLIALLHYQDGEKRYILAPDGLKVGDTVISSEGADLKPGNSLPLKNIPVGTLVHNLELTPGRGGQLVRAAGSVATVMTRPENGYIQVRMPSSEVRLIPEGAWAAIGQVSRTSRKLIRIGKAGRKIHMGIRPTVRGVAQHPASHPHGGGEGRSGIGMSSPKTPWGKPTLGKKTRRRFHTDRFILERRKKS